jgi:Gpi18-like mannosyltransferase
LQLAGKLKQAFSSELGKILLIGLSSRILIFVAAVVGAYFFGPGYSKLNSDIPFINFFSQWDGAWYNQIAIQGYPSGANPLSGNWAFFPVFPFMMRALGTPLSAFMPLSQATYVSGFILNNILFFAVLILFYKVTQKIFNNQRLSLISTVFFAFWPGSLFFSNVYSESLFMVFTLGAFYFLEKGSSAKATAFGFLAALTRSSGFLLLIPFIYNGLQTKKYKTAILQVFFVALPYLLFSVYGYFLTGLFPIREIVYSQIWGPAKSSPLPDAASIAGYALLYVVEGVLVALPFVWFATKDKISISSFVKGLNQRKDLKYWALSICIIVMLVFYSDPKNIHRYVLPMLPLYWTYAAIYLKNSRQGKVLFAISTVILIVGTVLFALGYWFL